MFDFHQAFALQGAIEDVAERIKNHPNVVTTAVAASVLRWPFLVFTK